MPVRYKFPFVIDPDYKHVYTEDEQKELIKCAMDVIYFAENYYTVIDADPNSTETEKIIKLYDFQKSMLKGFQQNQFNIILSSRQIGKTTVSCIFMLWYALFHENKEIGILANQHSTAMEIISDIKKAYELLPPFIKHGVNEYNKTNITFSNGTEIFAKATSEDALRGHTMSLVFLDEFAFVPQNIADGFWASNYPTISKSNGKIIIVSTPKGNAGLYHEIWSKAESGENAFVPHKVNWWEVPGRDEKWKETMLRNMSQLKFNQEFGCSFEGSSQTLIDGKYLVKLKSTDPAYTYGNHYFIWKKPEAKRVYTASVDSSQGTYGDNSVINIYDVTDFPTKQRYEQVALYLRNDLGIFDFAEEVYKICKQWNLPPIIIESNSGLGDVLLKVLYEEHDYEYVFYDYETGKYGINANKKTKPQVNEDDDTIVDPECQ